MEHTNSCTYTTLYINNEECLRAIRMGKQRSNCLCIKHTTIEEIGHFVQTN